MPEFLVAAGKARRRAIFLITMLPFVLAILSVSADPGLCRPFREIYPDGRALCETMWGSSFKYVDDARDDAPPAFSPS